MSNQRSRLNALVDALRRRRARDYPPILQTEYPGFESIDIVRESATVPISPDAADPASALGTLAAPADELMAGSPRPLTHFIHWEENFRPDKTVRAFCGVWTTEAQFSTEPSCLACIQAIADDEAALESTLKALGMESHLEVKP